MVVLALAIVARRRDSSPAARPYQFVESHPWIPAFGTGYTLGVDGIALALVRADRRAGAAAAGGRLERRPANDRLPGRATHAYVALTLAVEAMVLISLVSLDVLLFYVFFEAMLIPMYFLIGGFGAAPHRSRAAVKFLLYNLFGGLIMLAAVIGLYVVTAQRRFAGTFDFRADRRRASPRVGCGVDPGGAQRAVPAASCSRSRSRRRCGRSTAGCPTPRWRPRRRPRC